jgi:hypothetical protein
MKFDFNFLKSRIDLEGKYVDFGLLRTALTVERVVRDLATELTEANADGECRGICPKCRKERSFALNINTNRFNCFNKGCVLKGGGVIDLVAKLREIPAKEASHLLACAYGIQPYSLEQVGETVEVEPTISNQNKAAESREAVSRAEFEALKEKVERLSIIVWSKLFEDGEIEAEDSLFEDEYQSDAERETICAG